MGWDIVAMGTHHTLPIRDAVETAKRLAPLLDGVVSIGYCDRYRYDREANAISECGYEWKEVKEIKFNPNGWHYMFEIMSEAARRLQPQISSLEDVTWVGEYTKDWFMDDLFGTPYEIYRIEISEEKVSFGIDIFKENVIFDPSFNGRWFTFEHIFKAPYIGENKERLDDFRNCIFAQLKATGCDKAYYFPDQGYGEWLESASNLSSDEWVAYMESRKYIEDDDDSQLFVEMRDYLSGKIMLRQDQNAICIIDDFADLKE